MSRTVGITAIDVVYFYSVSDMHLGLWKKSIGISSALEGVLSMPVCLEVFEEATKLLAKLVVISAQTGTEVPF